MPGNQIELQRQAKWYIYPSLIIIYLPKNLFSLHECILSSQINRSQIIFILHQKLESLILSSEFVSIFILNMSYQISNISWVRCLSRETKKIVQWFIYFKWINKYFTERHLYLNLAISLLVRHRIFSWGWQSD